MYEITHRLHKRYRSSALSVPTLSSRKGMRDFTTEVSVSCLLNNNFTCSQSTESEIIIISLSLLISAHPKRLICVSSQFLRSTNISSFHPTRDEHRQEFYSYK